MKTTLETRNETTFKWEKLDLTLATSVTLYMLSTEPSEIEVHGTCKIIHRTEGYVEYEWEEGDTGTANLYRLQFKVLWSNGKTQTVPNQGYYNVEVQPDLADAP